MLHNTKIWFRYFLGRFGVKSMPQLTLTPKELVPNVNLYGVSPLVWGLVRHRHCHKQHALGRARVHVASGSRQHPAEWWGSVGG